MAAQNSSIPGIAPRRRQLAERVLVTTYAVTTLLSAAVAVRSAADHQQVHPALVRRQPGRVDDVHGLLSDAAVRRLCLRPSERKLSAAALASRRPSGAVGRRRLRCCRSRPTPVGSRMPTAAPTWRILCLLTVSVGLPYFVLSATGPLVQAWFCRSFSRSIALSAVCAVEFRFAGGAGRLSVLCRAAVWPSAIRPWLWGLAASSASRCCAASAPSARGRPRSRRRQPTAKSTSSAKPPKRPLPRALAGATGWPGWRCRHWLR